MSHEYLNKARYYLAAVDINATGNKLIHTPAVPVDLYRWGFVSNAAVDVVTDNFIIAIDHRPTAGSDTGRVEIQRMTFTPTQDIVAGTEYFANVLLEVAAAAGDDSLEPGNPAMPRSVINVGPAGPFLVNVGGELVVEVVDAAGSAGTVTAFIEVVEHDFAGARAVAPLGRSVEKTG